MATIATHGGTEIFSKNWGIGQPVAFSHGWPLTVGAWDDQLFGTSPVAKAVLLSAIPPLMLKTDASPGGLQGRLQHRPA